jgi:hypothetical protein
MIQSERIQAVRKRLQEMKSDEDAAKASGPPCSECVYGPINDTGEGLCDYIAHWDRRWDPVAGKWRGSLKTTTREARSETGLCGPEGLLWEPYTPARKVARWLARNGPMPLWYGALALFAAGFVIWENLG